MRLSTTWSPSTSISNVSGRSASSSERADFVDLPQMADTITLERTGVAVNSITAAGAMRPMVSPRQRRGEVMGLVYDH